jgi:6,7-dimethyl-8-ribityllumazine synthase
MMMGKGISKEIGPVSGVEVRQTVGALDASGLRFGLVVARFNDELTDELCRSAVGCLLKYGAAEAAVRVVRVPGAYEIPVVAEKLAASGLYDALIVLGVVVEGETQHAQMIIDTTGQSVLDISCRHQLPVINEIVGVRSWAQAEARCLGGENTRGWYAAEAAIEVARVMRQI